MKIAFTGSQGTGKTTKMYEIAAKIQKIGFSVTILSEVARSCPLPINEYATTDSQLWIFSSQLAKEQEKEKKSDVLITDRSLLDSYSYGLRINKGLFEKFTPFVEEYMKTYDALVYLKPRDEYLLDDGTRSVNKTFRDEIDEIITKKLEEMGINAVDCKDLEKLVDKMRKK